MSATHPVLQPDSLVQATFDSLRERICLIDPDGTILLTNESWNEAACESGAAPGVCGAGVNYLKVCRTAWGSFSEQAAAAATGIEDVLRGRTRQFSLDYFCPSPSRQAWYRLMVRPVRRPYSGAVILHSEITNQLQQIRDLRQMQAQCVKLTENSLDSATILEENGVIRYHGPEAEGRVGHSIFEFVHPDDAEIISKLLRDCRRHPGQKHICEYRCRDGTAAGGCGKA